MKKAYYLSSCSTCKKIIDQIEKINEFELQDIKTNRITNEQLQEMKKLAGSFESLFSRRAIKYRSMGLNEKKLTETDYEKLILEEYTFLKRPVFIVDETIFIGNSKKETERLLSKLK
jgi:arsenate reductase